MRTATKPVYYCDHCNKHGLSKPQMARHERLCFHNPENHRPCHDCRNLEKKRTEAYFDTPIGDSDYRMVNVFHCKAKKVFLYTPQNQIKGNQYETSPDNEPMPKECDLQNRFDDLDGMAEEFNSMFQIP